MKRSTIYLAIAALLIPAGLLSETRNGVNSVFGQREIPITFSHKLHVGEQELDCSDCHQDSSEVTFHGNPDARPDHETCMDCHSDAEEEKRCDMCHQGFESEEALEVAPLLRKSVMNFSHMNHLTAEVKCAECHQKTLEAETLQGVAGFPTMNECMDCHTQREAPNACADCHPLGDDHRLLTESDGFKLMPANHADADWLKSHKVPAEMDGSACYACHQQESCLSCHRGVEKPEEVHPNNWLLLHGHQGKLDSRSCLSCHESANACLDCHEKMRLGSGAAPGGWSPHPPNFNDPGSPAHHRNEARRNLASCAACHDDGPESSCLECHSAKGIPGLKPRGLANPHAGANLDKLKSNRRETCLICHTGDQIR